MFCSCCHFHFIIFHIVPEFVEVSPVLFFFPSTQIMSSVVDVHLNPTQSTKANIYRAPDQFKAWWCCFLKLQYGILRVVASNTVAITHKWLSKFN